jgi:hypothetical protein
MPKRSRKLGLSITADDERAGGRMSRKEAGIKAKLRQSKRPLRVGAKSWHIGPSDPSDRNENRRRNFGIE